MDKKETRRHSSISRKILLGLSVVWIVTVLIVFLNISALKIINGFNNTLASQINLIEQSSSDDVADISAECDDIQNHTTIRNHLLK